MYCARERSAFWRVMRVDTRVGADFGEFRGAQDDLPPSATGAGPASPPITAQHVPQGSATSGCQRGNREAGRERRQEGCLVRV